MVNSAEISYKKLLRQQMGARLSSFVAAKKWTNKVFADLVGIQPAHVKKYFEGELDPLNIADELISIGVDISWLLTGKSSEQGTSGHTISNNKMRDGNVLGIENVGAESGKTELLEKENEYLKQRIADLEEIIRLLKGNK